MKLLELLAALSVPESSDVLNYQISVVKENEDGDVGDVGVVDKVEIHEESKHVLIYAVQVGC